MKRPDFETALLFWQNLLRERGISLNLRWAFRENLCLAYQSKASGEFRLFFETQLNRITEEDVRFVYDFGKDKIPVLVFETTVQAANFTLCRILYDEWGIDDDIYIKEWELYYFAREPYHHYEEITDEAEWRKRKAKELRVLSGLDFVPCLESLRDEVKTGFAPAMRRIIRRVRRYIH